MSLKELELDLKALWDISLSEDDSVVLDKQMSENLYSENYYRTEKEKDMAQISGKQGSLRLGNSYHQAVRYYWMMNKR